MKVEVRNNDVMFAFRKLKKLLNKENVIKDYMAHTEFLKPSVKKRQKKLETIRNYKRDRRLEIEERGY
jgi:ribosomal protein S21